MEGDGLVTDSSYIPDSEVRLSFPDLYKRKTLFVKYNPMNILKLIAKKQNLILKKDSKQTRSKEVS